MEMMQVLHMKGGIGETSYANNSLLQKKVISMTKPITEQAIAALFSDIVAATTAVCPSQLTIADLGCSSGPNTLFAVTEIIKAVDELCEKTKKEPPEFQVFLNDLPGNDFNTIFRFLPSYEEKLRRKRNNVNGGSACFFSGVPGSFYSRLFPRESLHFVHSSYSLMWLSQVPKGLEGNKGNIYMASTSPPSVLRAYYEQFQRDFSAFLRFRGEEVVMGGRMVLTFLGRRSDDRSSKECCYIWELLATALNEMVSEGLIGEEKLDTFNIPQYTPSPKEVRLEVQREGSFSVDHLVVTEVDWNVSDKSQNGWASDTASFGEEEDKGYKVAKYMRAVAEPLLIDHFGEHIIEKVFKRYRAILSDRMSREKTKFFNLVVSLKRNG